MVRCAGVDSGRDVAEVVGHGTGSFREVIMKDPCLQRDDSAVEQQCKKIADDFNMDVDPIPPSKGNMWSFLCVFCMPSVPIPVHPG